MKVYRVEHTDGSGPYWNGAAGNFYRLFDEDHPEPAASGIKDVRFNEYFGFASKADMNSWFDKEIRKKFKQLDLHAFEYEVDPKYVRQGDKQAVFVMDAAGSRRKLH